MQRIEWLGCIVDLDAKGRVAAAMVDTVGAAEMVETMVEKVEAAEMAA